jgi:hypothetical protein
MTAGVCDVSSRLMIFGSALLIAAPAAAQDQTNKVTSPPPASVAAPTQPTLTTQSRAQLDRLRADVGTFEIVLQRAIDRAVLQTSQWAQQVVPDVVMSAAEPVVHGVPVGDASITFNVEVGGMVGVEMWQLMHQRLQPQPPQPQPDPNVQRVGTVGAQIVQADPSAGPPPRVTSNNADEQYSEYVRQAMIDAILDNSGVLQLKNEQTLAVAVIPTSVSRSGYRNSSATLILSIKGADLEQLRQGKISRDEAKRRIVETHF